LRFSGHSWDQFRVARSLEIEKQPADSTTTRVQNWKRIIPGLLVSLISLAIVFYIADIRKFVEAIKLADIRLVLLALFLTVVWLYVRSLAWRSLLLGKASTRDVFFTVNEGYLLNNVLPFRLGELGRSFLLSGKTELSFWEVFSTIIIERAIDVAMASGLLLITIPFVLGGEWATRAAVAAIALVLVGLTLFYLGARHHEVLLTWFEKWTKRYPSINRLGRTQLPLFFKGLSVLTQPAQFLRSISLFLLNWTLAVFQYYCLMLAFFPDARILWAGFSLSVTALGIAVPSSPGAVGVWELTAVAALSLFGLDPSTALAYAITAHLFNFLVTGLIGSYGFSQEGETLAGLYNRIRRLPENETPKT
jgi:uncharacterized protein (TIRG00374 family)